MQGIAKGLTDCFNLGAIVQDIAWRHSSSLKEKDMVPTFRFSALAGLSALALPLVPAIALAQDARNRPASDWVITRAQLNKTECTCRMRGENLPVGTEVCMQNGMFRCVMDQNVTSWRSLAAPCPQS